MLQNVAAKQNYHPYHALAEFRYGNEVVTNALIRLKGWSSWWQAADDKPPKMQFVIAFNEIDGNGRFHGQRKIELDMPRIDPDVPAPAHLARVPARARTARAVREQRARVHQRRLLRPVHEHGAARQGVHPAPVPRRGPRRPVGRRLGAGDQRGHDGAAAPAPGRVLGGDHPRGDRGDRRHGRGAAGMGGRGDARGSRRLLDRPLELVHLRSPGRAAGCGFRTTSTWSSTGPTRGSIRCTTGAATPAGRRRGNTISPSSRITTWSERYVAALRRAHEVYTAAQLPEMLDRFAAQVRDAAAADPTRPFSFDDHLREVAYLRQVVHHARRQRARVARLPRGARQRPRRRRRWAAVLHGLQGQRPGDVSGRGRDLRRRPRSGLRRHRPALPVARAARAAPAVAGVTSARRP